MFTSKKEIIKRLERTCNICGRKIKVILCKDGTYRGDIILVRYRYAPKKEINKTLKAGTAKKKISGLEVEVLKKDPKPYKYIRMLRMPQMLLAKIINF